MDQLNNLRGNNYQLVRAGNEGISQFSVFNIIMSLSVHFSGPARHSINRQPAASVATDCFCAERGEDAHSPR